jgi:hypothetical protein
MKPWAYGSVIEHRRYPDLKAVVVALLTDKLVKIIDPLTGEVANSTPENWVQRAYGGTVKAGGGYAFYFEDMKFPVIEDVQVEVTPNGICYNGYVPGETE